MGFNGPNGIPHPAQGIR